MLPGIKLCNDGKYRLFCGCCGSTRVRLEEVQKDVFGRARYEIYCQEFCNTNKRAKNAVCSIPNIKEFAIRDCRRDIDIYYKMLDNVYRQLELDNYISFDYKSLLIEKQLVQNLSIEELKRIEYAGKMKDDSYAYYYTSDNNIEYILRVKRDGKVYCKKQKDFNKKEIPWNYMLLIKM